MALPFRQELGIRQLGADRGDDLLAPVAVAAVGDHLDEVDLRNPELVEPRDNAQEDETRVSAATTRRISGYGC